MQFRALDANYHAPFLSGDSSNEHHLLYTQYTMPDFVLPPIQDNADGSWGPSTSSIPADFKE